MDVQSEKSPVHQLDITSKLENACEPKMWTVPSLTKRHLLESMGKFPDFMKDVMKKHIIPYISAEKFTFELDNASINILGPNNQRWKIISGHGKHEINIELTDIYDPVIIIKADDNKPEEIHCKEITKTFLGKCIVQKCGNEGANKNEPLRKLLQTTIDHLFDNNDKDIYKNAKVYIYSSDEPLILVSGDGRHSFVVNSEKGNPTVRYIFPSGKRNPSNTKLFGCVVVIVVVSGLLSIIIPFCFVCFVGILIWRIFELKFNGFP